MGVVNGFHLLNPMDEPKRGVLVRVTHSVPQASRGAVDDVLHYICMEPCLLARAGVCNGCGMGLLVGRAVKGQTSVWIGATRTSTANVGGWAWVDGTDASILNCGRTGCGLWINNEPGYVAATGGGGARRIVWMLTVSPTGFRQ